MHTRKRIVTGEVYKIIVKTVMLYGMDTTGIKKTKGVGVENGGDEVSAVDVFCTAPEETISGTIV